jgi:hypothetical protein
MPNQRILYAAIHIDDGLVYVHQPKNISTGYVICGRRHHNCIQTSVILGNLPVKSNSVQGFLTSDDLFLNRSDAAELAFTCGQIDSPTKILTSEDLW